MLPNLTEFIFPANFGCTIITENLILPNIYNVSISLVPIETSQNNIGLGFKKLRYFVEYSLQNCILISKENPLFDSISQMENNIVVLPTEPYDYWTGSVLLSKLSAITEKYFHIDCISIDSMVGDNVQYVISHPEECGLELEGDHWWNMDTLNTGSESDITWDDLNVGGGTKWSPKIVKGGLSEN